MKVTQRVTTSKLLANLKSLRRRIDRGRIERSAQLEVEILRGILKSLRLQLKYERLRRRGGISRISLFESGEPELTGTDAARLREAGEILREITNKLKRARNP